MKQEKLQLKKFWRRFWTLLEPSHPKIKLLLGLTVVFELFALLGPYLLKLIIDLITNFKIDQLHYLLLLVLFFFLSEQGVSLFNYIRDKKVFKLILDVEYYLPTKAQEKLVALSLDYHSREDTGSKIIKIEKGLYKITEFIVSLSWEVGPTLIQLFITLGVLLIVDWRFAIAFILFASLSIYITIKSNSTLYPIRKERHKNYEIASGVLGQSIININAVQSFVQEKKEIEKYRGLKGKIKKSELKEWFRLLHFGLYRNLATDLGRVSILLLGIYFVVQGSISIGTLVFVITLSEKSFFSLYRISRFYDRIAEGAEAVNRLARLFEEEGKIVNKKGAIIPKDIRGEIELKNVSFAYNNKKEQALKNVSFHIEAGKMVALVGPSGGGKTTIAKLIYRHYDPQSGEVLLDGVNLKDYNFYSFRRFLSIVPQEVEIFNISIRDNIAYAKPEASEEEIREAARIANADSFIVQTEKGYDTLVGERGIKLSGGQRQRIGIARAILVNPRVFIFDEATSSLDSQSEQLIQEAINRISKDRTMIVIAHRLSTVKKANKIIVLDQGKVVEQGSHKELLSQQGGLYAKLVKLQSMGELVVDDFNLK